MLKGLIRSAGLNAGLRDFDRYLMALDGGSDAETGALLLTAQYCRIRLEILDGVPSRVLLMPFSVDPEQIAATQWDINRAIKTLQASGEEMSAAGHMVWLHTLRAVSYAELRVHGRRLWGLLARGIPSARLLAEASAFEDPSPIRRRLAAEVDAIPHGLEPRNDSGQEYMPGRPGALVVEAAEADARAAHEAVKQKEAEAREAEKERVEGARRAEAIKAAEDAENGRKEPILDFRSAVEPKREHRGSPLEDLGRRIEAAKSRRAE